LEGSEGIGDGATPFSCRLLQRPNRPPQITGWRSRGEGSIRQERYTQGTLLVVNKAIGCVYIDEFPTTEEYLMSLSPSLRDFHERGLETLTLAIYLYSMLQRNPRTTQCILNLEGGPGANRLDVPLMGAK